MAEANAESKKRMYDEAMRSWAESSPARLAAWLDPSLAGLPPRAFVLHSTALNDRELQSRVIRPDLAIGVGPDRVMHVEYETSPRPALGDRMYKYRGRLMENHPGLRITQHVIVLREGLVQGYDAFDTRGFSLDVRPVYLRERIAEEFLKDPFLAQFAALARGSPAVREQSLAAAIRLLLQCGDPLAQVWLPAAISLAEVHLDRSTIDRIVRESVMSVGPYVEPFVERFRDHPWGRELISKGREEGRKEGVAQGGERVLLEALRTRFGDSPQIQEAARILGGWEDVAAAVAAVSTAKDPASLLSRISK
jgi:hypothetical protein